MSEQKYDTIIYKKDKDEPKFAWIILNRPEKTNAIF